MWRLRFFFIVAALLIGSVVGIVISFDTNINFDSSFSSDDNEPEIQRPLIELQSTYYQNSNTRSHTHTRAEVDSDDDGLNDDEEIFFGTDPDDKDSDDDGVFDGHEGLDSSKGRQHIINDPDQDGWNNAVDADSDDDGVLDGTEIGLIEADLNLTATDLSKGRFYPDQDPASTTDMTKWDTDGDTWSDGDEDKNADGKYQPDRGELDPNYKDYDDDRLQDDTQDEDDDNDGMPDAFEKLYTNALHPLDKTDREEDFDYDGYTNIEEYLGKDKTGGNNDWSDPEDPLSTPLIDADGDGVDDFDDAFPEDPAASIDNDDDGCPEEWNPGKSKSDSISIPKLELDLYPDDPFACLDTDGDNMPNELKGDHPTLTEDTDDDDDGIPDWWELEYSFNPLNASDSMSDADGDGFSNVNEYFSDTDPRNPDSYPEINIGGPGENGGSQTNEEEWLDFIVFLIFVILIAMFTAIIIGYFIMKKRKREDEFWMGTFGESQVQGIEFDDESRKRYDDWRRRIEAEGAIKREPGYRYRLEIIGGPSESDLDRYGRRDIIGPGHGHRQQTNYKRDPRLIGRSCLWCDKGITRKYIKRCPELRPNGRRCPDGPFCSKKCLNEHLRTVPHHREFIF